METLEPRLNAWRPDLADIRLQGRVEAKRFAAGTPRRVVDFVAPLKRTPRADAPLGAFAFTPRPYDAKPRPYAPERSLHER